MLAQAQKRPGSMLRLLTFSKMLLDRGFSLKSVPVAP